MDIFKFHNPVSSTKLEQGEIVNGLDSKMWIERYRSAGEFKFVADASLGLKEILPTGTLVSHTGTTEVMIVENHEINDQRGKEPQISVTGRGFETFLENRVVGSNQTFPKSGTLAEFVLPADFSWEQAKALIEEYILASELIDDSNALSYVEVLAQVEETGVAVSTRTIKRGDVYSRLLEILDADNLGIKIVRPGLWSPLSPSNPNTVMMIHKGVDRSSEVVFSYETGEIESADYLWSNKKVKNAALITGRWVETAVITEGPTGYSRRWMFIDASDIDNSYSAAPTGATLTAVINAMRRRGLDALAAQKDVSLTKAEVSKETLKARYRTDFDVGDLITVNGAFNEVSTMRISEYVEIEDETGVKGYPTLTIDE